MSGEYESNADIEWRQALLNFSKQLKSEEISEIAYLYKLPEKFRETQQGFVVLEELEKKGHLSSNNLPTVFHRIKRKDLEKQAKDFVTDFASKKQNECPCKKKAEMKSAIDSASYHLLQGAYPQIMAACKLAEQCSNKDSMEAKQLLKALVEKFQQLPEIVQLFKEDSSTVPTVPTVESTGSATDQQTRYQPLPALGDNSRHLPLPKIPAFSDPVPETAEKDSPIDPVYETVRESFSRTSPSRTPVRTPKGQGPPGHQRLSSSEAEDAEITDDGRESDESDADSDHSYEQVKDIEAAV